MCFWMYIPFFRLNNINMQNEILSLIPEYLSLGVVFYDKDGYLKYTNNTALKMFGTTMEQVFDINIFEDPNVTAEDKAALKKGLNVSFETDYDFELCGETFFNTEIKTWKYFVTKMVIMRSAEGDLQGYLLTCEDVTEKKAQEKKIKSVQQELALALNAGKLASWNYRIEEGMFYKFDYDIENLEKRSLEFICESIHLEDRDRFSRLLDAIICKEEYPDDNIVLRVMEKGWEDYRYYSFTYCPKEDEDGNVVVITFIQQDITEDIIYQQNLILAKNRAEEADKLKSTFLANMSHEIRTPLNAIVGFSELLSDTENATERCEYKQLIETNSDILLRLIGDILDLSKIEAGSIDIKRQRLNLLQLCNELYLSFQQRIKNSDVTLRLISPYSKCVASFDKYRFIQIFTNFVTNAIKYTPSGEIVMGYECAPGQVRLYVKDTGIGIPEKKKNRIFSRFEKLDNFAQGTGLGLSICKAIADATGGEVGFESEENVGSEFWYVACTDVEYTDKMGLEVVTVEEEEVSEQDFSVFSEKLGHLNILVAEDNDSNFRLVKNILKDNDLDRAITGAEALEKARNNSYDLIFMDLRMPVMDGLEATFLIRQFNEKVPILALTANAFDSDKEAALAVGCNHFITKPLKKKELMKLLSDYVNEMTF